MRDKKPLLKKRLQEAKNMCNLDSDCT